MFFLVGRVCLQASQTCCDIFQQNIVDFLHEFFPDVLQIGLTHIFDNNNEVTVENVSCTFKQVAPQIELQEQLISVINISMLFFEKGHC